MDRFEKLTLSSCLRTSKTIKTAPARFVDKTVMIFKKSSRPESPSRRLSRLYDRKVYNFPCRGPVFDIRREGSRLFVCVLCVMRARSNDLMAGEGARCVIDRRLYALNFDWRRDFIWISCFGGPKDSFFIGEYFSIEIFFWIG